MSQQLLLNIVRGAVIFYLEFHQFYKITRRSPPSQGFIPVFFKAASAIPTCMILR